MSGTSGNNQGTTSTYVITPKQASDIYSSHTFPKQRSTFVVRFNKASSGSGTPTTGQSTASAGALTYIVKAVDRPNIEPTAEEINQYNKKRQIYTGYKKSPVKCIFYDDGASSAVAMWADYTKYYFGDFATTAGPSGQFADDVMQAAFAGSANEFGFNAKNGGNSNAGSQFYFTSIDILHFHGQIYDKYTLINPRINSFALDELDYEQSAISTVTATFVYEAVTITVNNPSASTQPEFASGSGQFNGRTDAASPTATDATTPQPSSLQSALTGAFSGVQQLFGSTANSLLSSLSSNPDFRYFSSAVGGGLSSFGNFGFGSPNTSVPGSSSAYGSQMAALAAGNPAIASVFGIGGASGNPLTTTSPLGVYQQSAGFSGIPSQYPGAYSSATGSSTSYGPNSVLAAGIAASLLNGGKNLGQTVSGLALSSLAMSVINAQQPGSAQYGFNPSLLNGVGYGQQGPSGVTGPLSQLYSQSTQPTPAGITPSQWQPTGTPLQPGDVQALAQISANVSQTPQTPPTAAQQALTNQIASVAAAQNSYANPNNTNDGVFIDNSQFDTTSSDNSGVSDSGDTWD